MDHIFGNSDDISFGAASTPPKSSVPHNKKPPISSPRGNPVREHRPGRIPPARATKDYDTRRPHQSTQVEPPSLGDAPALTRLINGMKPSFLPNEDNMNLMRAIVLSSAGEKNPLTLLRSDATTVLIGTGFGTIVRAGKVYPTFPDMRIIFSEKDRLHAWILTDEGVNIELFEQILPTLEFPPIYATRDIISRFRNTIKDASFLEKCRFFELFVPGVMTRRIGDFEFSVANSGTDSMLSARVGSNSVGFSLYPLSTLSHEGSPQFVISSKDGGYLLGNDRFEAGEILMFQNKSFSKHTLKYTFDTFYVDNSSIGIVAGYTLSDREMLAENGILTFTLEEDIRARTIAGHIFIDSRGFVHAHEMMGVHKEILKGIRATYEKLIVENERIERGELVQSLRREITKYCFLLTGRTPVVMPIVIER
ncbi:hypothetical protein KBD33_02315 [Candidatus Gracilibacteria bacterium]|nr:hypothetical protein [Candidatus Gracilibacteria bacterium]